MILAYLHLNTTTRKSKHKLYKSINKKKIQMNTNNILLHIELHISRNKLQFHRNCKVGQLKLDMDFVRYFWRCLLTIFWSILINRTNLHTIYRLRQKKNKSILIYLGNAVKLIFFSFSLYLDKLFITHYYWNFSLNHIEHAVIGTSLTFGSILCVTFIQRNFRHLIPGKSTSWKLE